MDALFSSHSRQRHPRQRIGRTVDTTGKITKNLFSKYRWMVWLVRCAFTHFHIFRLFGTFLTTCATSTLQSTRFCTHSATQLSEGPTSEFSLADGLHGSGRPSADTITDNYYLRKPQHLSCYCCTSTLISWELKGMPCMEAFQGVIQISWE